MHSKKGKGTTMNKLYNIPNFKGIPLGSANIIYVSASLPKIKRKIKISVTVFIKKKGKANTINNGLSLSFAFLLYDRAQPTKRKRRKNYDY